MDGFALTKEQSLGLKRKRETAQLAKNECLVVVLDADALLEATRAMLQTASPTDTFGRLILPLLLVTGRRLTEVLSSRSTFAPCAH
eukprot:3109462-Prymnesium_polylepis.1